MLTVGALRDRYPEAEFRFFNLAGHPVGNAWFYTPVRSYAVKQQGDTTTVCIFVAEKKPLPECNRESGAQKNNPFKL